MTGCSEYLKKLIYWDFHAKPSLGFRENGPKKRKYPVSGSECGQKCLDVRGEWADWLEMIERQQ